MTELQWKTNLKKYLYLLPAKEEKDILSYYDELFSDYYEQGFTDEEIILELGDPKEVAKAMVADYMDDSDAIDTKEETRSDRSSVEKAHDVGLNIRNKFISAGSHISSFCDGLSADSRKKKSPLSSTERQEYESEIRKHREEERVRSQETRRRSAEERRIAEKERIQEIRRKNIELNTPKTRGAEQVNAREGKEKQMTNTKLYEINDDESDYEEYSAPTSKALKRKTYTQAQRHSFLTNFMYVIFMILFLIIGLAIAVLAVAFLAMTIWGTINYVGEGISTGSQFLVDLGYIIILFGAGALCFGIGTGIFIGSIRKLHKRFFEKKYIMLKKHTD